MDFGRLPDISSIDFSLPEDHPGTVKVLGGKPAERCMVSVGCPIWAEEGFVGKIYPEKTKNKDYLKYYGQQYNSIELNISHYKHLDAETIDHWLNVTPGDFKFFPKVHQFISHTPYLKQNAEMLRQFMETQKAFKQKLGIPFLQLPPYYDSTKLEDLLDLFDTAAVSRIAVELRHDSWFKDEQVMKQVCNYFYKNNITFLITDTAGRRDVLHQRLTTQSAFIRFVANDLHASDFERMNAWIERLKHWINNGLEELFFFFHTPDHSLMPELSIYFIENFTKQTGITVRQPKILVPKPKVTVNKLF